MRRYRTFAYAQARLQSRQGDLPDESLWRRLDALRSPASFLQTARASAMRPWVESLATHQSVHEIEARLRARWRRYVSEVAHFAPKAWRPSVEWFSLLPDLAVIGHLRADLPAPAWVRSDPRLHPLAEEIPDVRARIWGERPFAFFAIRGSDPIAVWRDRWRALAPAGEGAAPWQGFLSRALALAAPTTGRAARLPVEASLRNAFHRHAFTPAALFIHLLLVFFAFERLRGALSQRLLFVVREDIPTP